ncbi:MAG TPA: response regulator [Polyangiaceae bacterium]
MQDESKTVVLVADDEPSVLAMVSSHLRAKGYSVLEASDGDQAWELAHEHLPDLVVLDVMMPGMSGWEVCRKIREAVSLAHTGVVMLTGIGENLNEMTSPLYGADAHVDKPFEFADLDERIEETLERRRAGAVGRVENEGEDDEESEPAPARKKRGKGEVPHRPTLPAGAAQDEELDEDEDDEELDEDEDDELDTMDEDEDDEELDEDEDDEELAADFESDDEALKPPVKARPKTPIAKSSGKKKAPVLELSEPPKPRPAASKAAAKSPSAAKTTKSDEGAKPLAEAATSVAGAMFKRAASALKNVPKSVVSALTPASAKSAGSKSGSAAKPVKKTAAPAKAAKPVKKTAAPAKAPAKTGRTASKKAAIKAAPPKAPQTKAAKATTKPAKATAKSVARQPKKSSAKPPKAPSKALQASTMTAANAVTDRGNRAKRAAHVARKPKSSPAKGKAVPNRKPKR